MGAVTFPDVETMCVAFAQTRTTADVATKIANPRPVRYARVWRTGGGAVNRVLERAQITVTCGSAVDDEDASAIARELRHAFLNGYASMPLVRGVDEVVGPYFDPDPDTGEDRYTFTLQLLVRGKR